MHQQEYPYVATIRRRRPTEHISAPQIVIGGHPENAATLGDGLELGPSLIPGGGDGVFASRGFQQGDIVTEYGGEVISTKYEPKREQLRDSAYVMSMSDRHVLLDGLHVPRRAGQPAAQWINDAANPELYNVTYAETTDPWIAASSRPHRGVDQEVPFRIWVYALRDIEPGEELFVSYGDRYWDGQDEQPYALSAEEAGHE